MADVERINAMSIEDDNQKFQNNPASEKKTRTRKTKAERIAEKKAKRDKKQAEVDQLTREIEWDEKSASEKKKYKKMLEIHCTNLAGGVALKLFSDKNQKFDRITFKNTVLSMLKNFEEKEYFGKIFDE